MKAATVKKLWTDEELRERLILVRDNPNNKMRPLAVRFVQDILGPKRNMTLTTPQKQFAKDILRENGIVD